MNSNSFFKFFFLVFTVISLASCDNDSNELGTDIVGNDNFDLQGDPFKVTAYNMPLGAVQTSNLGIQQFGIYDDPVFGTTTAHAVVQVTLQTENPTFGEMPEVTDVELNIPYFSHVVTPVADQNLPDLYELDSIWGSPTGKLNLQIFQSDYYLRPDIENGGIEKYYSDQLDDFTIIGTQLNNSATTSENSEFVFTNTGTNEVPLETPGGAKIKIAPKMAVHLDKNVFNNILFGPQAAGKLVNNNIFTNYFRGLHFKVSRSGSSDPRLAMINLAGGTITVTYKQRTAAAGDGDAMEEGKKLYLKLTANSVNLFEYEHSAEYQNLLTATPNTDQGDQKLYIKGGAGSMAVIELFKTREEINALKATKGKWLVNDASLNFFVEETANDLLDGNAPKRIYLYDLNNNKVLVDYLIDQSQSNNAKYNKNMHGGIIDRVSSPLGTMYRVRITNHIKAIIANTEENFKTVRLGLVVTENINTTSNKSLEVAKLLNVNNIFGTEEQDDHKIDVVPTMSIAHPFGTVLWGTNLPENDPRRLKLTIHFTKPN